MNLEDQEGIKKISKYDLEKNFVLDEGELLLKVSRAQVEKVGFMCGLNKTGTIPSSWLSWKRDGDIFTIKEEFRKGWRILRLRAGMSTAWVRILHPFGFILEINGTAFSEVIDRVTIINGEIQERCKFSGAIKNSKLIIENKAPK